MVGVSLALIALLLTVCHLLALHEGPDWTSPLLIGDHLFDLLVAVALLWYCLGLGRWFGRITGLAGSTPMGDMVAMGLGLGLFSEGLLCLGFLRLYYAPVFLGIVLVTAYLLRDDLIDPAGRGMDALLCWLRNNRPIAPTLGLRLALLCLLLPLGLFALLAFLPVNTDLTGIDRDALQYHLAAPGRYLHLHMFVPVPDLQLANAPSGGDLLALPGMFVGTDSYDAVLNVLLYLLLGVVTYTMGRDLYGPVVGWIAALSFLTTLWLGFIVPSTFPDLATALLIALGTREVLLWCAGGSATNAPGARTWQQRLQTNAVFIRAGLLCGSGISFKLTSAPIAPALWLTVAAPLLLGARTPLLRRLLDTILAEIFLGVALALPLAPWLIKNVVFFGRPLYPEGIAVSDGTAAQANVAVAGVSVAHPSLFDHAQWLLGTLITIAWRYETPLSCCLLLAPFLLRGRVDRVALLLLLSASLIWLLLVPTYLPPRYWLGITPLFDVLAAAATYAMLRRVLAWFGGLGLAIITLLLLLNGTVWLAVVPFNSVSTSWLILAACGQVIAVLLLLLLQRQQERTALLELPVVAYLLVTMLLEASLALPKLSNLQAMAYDRGAVSRNAFLLAHDWPYPVQQWANTHLPPDARLALANLSLGYYFHQPYLADWNGSAAQQLEGSAATRRALLQSWCTSGIQYAVLDTAGLDQAGGSNAQPPAVAAWLRGAGAMARIIYTWNAIEVLAARPCSVTSLDRTGP
jgi:hypothetical protein